MSDKPFDRTIFNRLERPASSDWNQLQSQMDRTIREVLANVFATRIGTGLASGDRSARDSGFIHDGFKVFPKNPASMVVTLTAGMGFQQVAVDPANDTAIGGIVGLSDLSDYKPMLLSQDQDITLDPSDPVLDRYDLIEVRADRRTENNSSVMIYDSAGKVYNPTPKDKTLAFDLAGRIGRVTAGNPSTTGIGYKVGTPAAVGTAVPPTVTSGYKKVAIIKVSAALAAVDYEAIQDWRRLLFPSGILRVSMVVNYDSTGPKATVRNWQVPPGVTVGLSANDAGGPQIFICAGESQFNSASVSGYVQLYSGDQTKMFSLAGYSLTPANHAINSVDRAMANNALRASPQRRLADDQPCVSFIALATRTTAGATAAAVIGTGASSVDYHLDFALS